MHSLRKGLLLTACLLAAACTKAQNSTSDALDTVGNETSASYNKMRDMLDLGHKPKDKGGKPAQSRYCYHTYQDIICYSHPLPGEEYRLVAFQESNGNTGYTMPPVPGGDMNEEAMPPLKVVTVTSTLPVKSVGEGTPQPKSRLKEIIFDPAELEPKELVPEKPQ